jgi:hypothetical protein
VRLYRSKEHPDHWIGEDEHGALLLWPVEPKGWLRRTPYIGGKRQLEEVEPALARGTGWPGGGHGPAPRAGVTSRNLGIRVADHERTAWESAARASDRKLSDWIRSVCNTAAAAFSRSKK